MYIAKISQHLQEFRNNEKVQIYLKGNIPETLNEAVQAQLR